MPHEAAIPYSIRRSERARRVRVSVDAARGVEVVLPRRAPERAASEAVAELRPWIERRVREVEHARAAIAARGERLPYLGGWLELRREPGRVRAHRRGDVLLVPDGDHRPAAERWLRRAARREIGARLDRAAAQAGLAYMGLTIRGQRSRWASCSPKGAMSFNWRLMLAPSEVVDYVVWHEICHLEVADHSPAFWQLVERRCPRWREYAAWLRDHGATLAL